MGVRTKIKVADEVWIATALLHREQPQREGFSVAEIVDRASREGLAGSIRPGVAVHAYQHCVANVRPNPGRHKMLYALQNGERRLFREGDDYHPYREGGKITPNVTDVPDQYAELISRYSVQSTPATLSIADRKVDYVANSADSAWDQLAQIWDEVPVEERLKIPSDGASCHDRYIRANR